MPTNVTIPVAEAETPEALHEFLQANRRDTFKGFFRGVFGGPDIGEVMAFQAQQVLVFLAVARCWWPHFSVEWFLVLPFALIALSRYFTYSRDSMTMLKALTGAYRRAAVGKIEAIGSQLGINSQQNGPAATDLDKLPVPDQSHIN